MARNVSSGQMDPQIRGVFDQPFRDFNHSNRRQREAQPQAEFRGEHLVGQDSHVLRVILEFRHIEMAIRGPHEMGLRPATKRAQVLDRADVWVHGTPL